MDEVNPDASPSAPVAVGDANPDSDKPNAALESQAAVAASVAPPKPKPPGPAILMQGHLYKKSAGSGSKGSSNSKDA